MASTSAPDGGDTGDTMNILLATDCHLGYLEKDVVRGNDSMETFEEILQIAQQQKVDFILLGGDLFHDNKPSRHSLHNCMALLRKYCMGSKPCEIELLSDQSVNFGHSKFPTVNYEDVNLNVSMPVFSIHGNHDDPAGLGNLCALDLLSVAGLVNYFGKTQNLDQIEISPLLLTKGNTKLALYGLGSIRDERLHRMFLNKQVRMLRPKENTEDWFNVLVLHQNRSKHTSTNYIPEQFLDDFLDLIFWGHEHECKIDPVINSVHNFFVTQPGSSVATSLSEGETRKKHVGLLKVHGKQFQIEKIPLKTVRQFYMEDIDLESTSILTGDADTAKMVENYCIERADTLISEAERKRLGCARRPEKPLVRLRLFYTPAYDLFQIYRFGQKFVDKVANPKDMIAFHKKKAVSASKLKREEGESDLEIEAMFGNIDTKCVEEMLEEYFQTVDKKKQLSLLSTNGMSLAVKRFVEKEEREAIEILVTHELSKTQEFLRDNKAEEENLPGALSKYREDNKEAKFPDSSAYKKASQSVGAARMGFDSDEELEEPAPKRGRGRGRGSRATPRARAGRGSRGSRSKQPPREEIEISDDDDEDGINSFFAPRRKKTK